MRNNSYLRRREREYLYSLHLRKGLGELCFWMIKGIDVLCQQKIHRSVHRETIEQIRDLQFLPRAADVRDQPFDVFFQNLQIRDPVLDELGPDELPAVLPQLSIRGKDGSTQEILPFFVKFGTLSKIVELGREDGLDVFGVGGEDISRSADRKFNGGGPPLRMRENPFPEDKVAVFDGIVDTLEGKIDIAW